MRSRSELDCLIKRRLKCLNIMVWNSGRDNFQELSLQKKKSQIGDCLVILLLYNLQTNTVGQIKLKR